MAKWFGLLLSLTLFPWFALADDWKVVITGPNGDHVPKIIGASGSINSPQAFTGFDYFEWFGITHLRYWFKPSFSPLNPTGNITNKASFEAAVAALRADPLRQGTAYDIYIDWGRFNTEFDATQRVMFQRFQQLGIQPMLVDTMKTDRDTLMDWGAKFQVWKYWYGYVYFFASHYRVTMYEFDNEPEAKAKAGKTSYGQWESQWLISADAMRKAMADVNAKSGRCMTLSICGPTCTGPAWDYGRPDPNVDAHGWGSVSWAKVQTNIEGQIDPSIWNYTMYDYHSYDADGKKEVAKIKGLRHNLAHATNAPNATIPLLISEYNTGTGRFFKTYGKDTEDLDYGIDLAQILQSTAMLGPAGLGDEGGFFLFKLSSPDSTASLLGNRTVYMSAIGDQGYGGVSRGGVCFQLYARHFRGGKPVLGYRVTAGASDKRRLAAVWDEEHRAYYLYFSNLSGTDATASLDLRALDVLPDAPVTVARVDMNNTGQITEYLAVDAEKKVTLSVPNHTAILLWISQGDSAAIARIQPPSNDTYLVVGESEGKHGAEPTMRVSLHHATAGERRIGFLQFNLKGLAEGTRFLLKLNGRNIGTSPTTRDILHVYGAGSADWSEANLAWLTAPGVGKYYTGTDTLGATTGRGLMVDIEDNYGGTTSGLGEGLGLYGKFLGPISFSSSSWVTNYVDVTDYVKSLLAAHQTRVTFVLAHIVRYDVNQYNNNSYYAKGVYDYDGQVVEIGAKENPAPDRRPALVVWTPTT